MAGILVDEQPCPVGGGFKTTCDYTGAMLVIGRRTAMITLSMNREAATLVVAYMTGISPTELGEDDVADGMAELVNMIAGSSKSSLVGTDFHFRITLPFVLVGENQHIVYKSKPVDRCRHYFAGDIEAILELVYLEG
ncbi:chemotaxis protein CheX [Heliobacterium mobile]|nr:chemotaxis protein CheX [Heliobacterium mobile]